MLIIIRGLPGSTKSTTAQRLKAHFLGLDFTVAICSNDNYPGYYDNPEKKYDWTPQKAKLASKYCWSEFETALRLDIDVIILDNTNLSRKSYGKYEEAAKAAGHEVSFVEFEPPLDNAIALDEYIKECANRNTHGVSYAIIKQMIKAWEPSALKAKPN